MYKKLLLLLAIIVSANINLKAEADSTTVEELSEAEIMALYQAFADSIESTLNYETGRIDLKDDLAEIQVPEGFKFLNAEQSEMVLTDLWGNPPGEGSSKSLGMLFPINATVLGDSTFAIDINFSEEGYIDDSDASDIDYTDLLNDMQESVLSANEQRVAMGYEKMELVGWAAPPYYDQANKKLHWAKELKFGEAELNTLNYNIRILGRRGYLVLNAIADIDQLNLVQGEIDNILASVNFKEGHRYSDFDPSIDKVAAIGIGGLIAGKVLAKTGFFAMLAKFGKFIVVGLIAAFAGLRRFLTGRRKEEEPTA